MSTSLLYHAFRVRGYHYQSTKYAGGGVTFTITQPRESYRCAVCGSADVIGKGKHPRRFRTLPIGGKPVYLELDVPRGTGKGMADTTRFNVLADRYGFIAAYPDGMVEPRSWNSLFGTVPGGEGVTADDVEDVAFTRTLIDALHASYFTDRDRVFVCGLSSGAHMSYRLAVELSDRIAAVGIVNGSLGITSVDGNCPGLPTFAPHRAFSKPLLRLLLLSLA